MVPRAAATAFLPELVENLDDVSIVALIVCVAEGADAAPGLIIIIMQVLPWDTGVSFVQNYEK